jgi:molybdopterin synthase sulfur carrier subunit
MPLTFYIPGPLRTFTDGHEKVEIKTQAAAVRDALDALWGQHPALRDRILTEQGEVRRHINIFVGKESIQYTGGLATSVPAGAEIMIVPAVSGG